MTRRVEPVRDGQPITAQWANAVIDELASLRQVAVSAPLRMHHSGAGLTLGCERESEPELVELLANLSVGGSCTAKRKRWDSATTAYVDADAANITVHDVLGTFTGSAGDRAYVFFHRGSGRWEILQLAC